MRRSILVLLLGTLSAGVVPTVSVLAAEVTNSTADPVGDWIGGLDVGAPAPIRVALHVKHAGNLLTATADSPDQGALDIAVSEINADGDHLNFAIESIEGQYAGTWDPAKQRYVGTWTQGGRILALEFARGKYPPPATAHQTSG